MTQNGNAMTELTISSDEIRSAIESYVSEYSPEVTREEVGIVAETGDGIATVEGLPSAMSNELLSVPGRRARRGAEPRRALDRRRHPR